MVTHLVMNIDGFLESLNEKKDKNLYCIDMFGICENDVMKAIFEMKNKGMKFIPGKGCKNVGKDGDCECDKIEE